MLKPKEVKVKFPLLDGVLDLSIERIQYRLLTEFDWDDKHAPQVLANSLPARLLEAYNQAFGDGELKAVEDAECWAKLTLSDQVERLTLECMYLMKALDKAGLLEGLIEDYYRKYGHFRQQASL